MPPTDSAKLTPFATEFEFQAMPRWSPKGDRIAYVAAVDGVLQIFTKSLNSVNADADHSRVAIVHEPVLVRRCHADLLHYRNPSQCQPAFDCGGRRAVRGSPPQCAASGPLAGRKDDGGAGGRRARAALPAGFFFTAGSATPALCATFAPDKSQTSRLSSSIQAAATWACSQTREREPSFGRSP